MLKIALAQWRTAEGMDRMALVAPPLVFLIALYVFSLCVGHVSDAWGVSIIKFVMGLLGAVLVGTVACISAFVANDELGDFIRDIGWKLEAQKRRSAPPEASSSAE